jgi:hypothetical protein
MSGFRCKTSTVETSPFALSLSKGSPSFEPQVSRKVQGFDKLSPNGIGCAPCTSL